MAKSTYSPKSHCFSLKFSQNHLSSLHPACGTEISLVHRKFSLYNAKVDIADTCLTKEWLRMARKYAFECIGHFSINPDFSKRLARSLKHASQLVLVVTIEFKRNFTKLFRVADLCSQEHGVTYPSKFEHALT